jgi:hypothetical protein
MLSFDSRPTTLSLFLALALSGDRLHNRPAGIGTAHSGGPRMHRSLYLWTLLIVLGVLATAGAGEKDPPKGFEPLFNGKDLTGWKVNVGGKMELWGAEDGVLYVKGGGGGWLMTEKEYDDFELRLEFKLPEKGNSGVALRSERQGNPATTAGMEIQLLDDEWHKKNYKGLKNTQLTGSIYGIVPPSQDALKKIGEWNQMHITAKGRQITVELNGVKIVDANLDDHKASEKDHPGMKHTRGHIGLQSHDGRVEFRNIYLKPLGAP